MWDRLFWTERTVYHHGDLEIYLSRPKDVPYKDARKQAARVADAWTKEGRPSYTEIVQKIREQNVTVHKGHRGVKEGRNWRRTRK